VRELHVVAVSEDGRHVLLAGTRGATKGGFRVALDDRLAAALKGDLPSPGQQVPHPSDLTPKEIQARLRAGESAEAIAMAAGVPVARVERFSGPVQGEMARMIDATRNAYVVRGRRGRSALPLGEAVDLAIDAAPSVREDSSEWSTHREEAGTWLVKVTWYARKRSREAAWRYDPAARTVAALDPPSAAMAHVDAQAAAKVPRRGSAAASTTKAPARKTPARKAAVRTAAAQAPPRTSAAGKKAVTKKPVTKKPVTKKPLDKVGPARKAVTRPAPVARVSVATPPKNVPAKKAPVAKASARKAVPARKATVKKAAPDVVRGPVRRPARALRVVPDPTPTRAPKQSAEQPLKRPTAAERDGVKTRATVPGWADVLLGTSPGSDR
jgi:hypothetical protein